MPKTIPTTKAIRQHSKDYGYPEASSPNRPDAGVQPHYNKRYRAGTFRYDASLSPVLHWDGQNPAREYAEALIQKTLDAVNLEDAKAAATELARMSKPFLDWVGKAERLSFDVPTLPLFVHEQLSTQKILETLKGHRFDRNQESMLDLWGEPQRSVADQLLRAYEYQDKWVNRMILGDSLVVMNSLLHLERLAGQVQMIYVDPPYGVRFGSNFQPFVRKRDVDHNDDADMTREPEMVQAYRDTWELGLHSYLTYLRDRLLLARDLLHASGSVFVQIGDENVHHVRELMDEVFGKENFVALINFKTMMPLESGDIESVYDYLCWYSRDKEQLKYRNLYVPKKVGEDSEFVFADTGDNGYRRLTREEIANFEETSRQFAVFKRSDLTSSGYTPSCTYPIEFEGQTFVSKRGKSWRTTPEGVEVLKSKNRLFVLGKKLYYKMYLRDFGYTSLTNSWHDTIEFGGRLYVVQTTSTVVERCIHMTTNPGDLVLDPTCGGGTTAYCAEKLGRRWITIDTSRVPLALARQRLLTATFPWYELQDDNRGPAGGFVYKRKQNKSGEQVGGIVPHVTLKSIANNEPADEAVLVNKPEENSSITRVTGSFCFEATIPTPQEVDQRTTEPAVSRVESDGSFTERMFEILRRSPVLRLEGNKTLKLKNLRAPARTLSLSAEAIVPNGTDKPVAFLFGPENAAISEKLVYEAAREAHAKSYSYLYVIGFAIEPNARILIEKASQVVGVPATYVQATPDLMMGDLLKNMRSSQIFSVCGLPDVEVRGFRAKSNGKTKKYEVELLGLDVFDPIEMVNHTRDGSDVPAWFLDTDYNNLCFRVRQAFFPRTSAWENLRKALRGEYEESIWEHLSGNVSAPFEPGKHGQVAVKVIDDRGNELTVVKNLLDAK